MRKIVRVEFGRTSGVYDYFIPDYIEEVNIGDKVVVDGCRGYTIAEVVDVVDEFAQSLATKYIISVIDDKPYKEFIEKAKEREALMKQMEKRLEESNKLLLFKQLSETDSVMKELLEKLQSL